MGPIGYNSESPKLVFSLSDRYSVHITYSGHYEAVSESFSKTCVISASSGLELFWDKVVFLLMTVLSGWDFVLNRISPTQAYCLKIESLPYR